MLFEFVIIADTWKYLQKRGFKARNIPLNLNETHLTIKCTNHRAHFYADIHITNGSACKNYIDVKKSGQ